MTTRMLLLAACAAAVSAQNQPVLGEETVKVSEHVWAIMGFPNIAIVVGSRATLVVDTGLGPANGATIARVVAKLAPGDRKLFLTTTHFHPEHAAGEAGFPSGTVLIRDAVQQREMEVHGKEMVEMFSSRSAKQKELLANATLRTPDITFDTEAKVDLLVVLYAINVFVTFTLSQLGMSAHWWSVRKTERGWGHKLLINGIGCAFTLSILLITLTLKFNQGGWVTIVITSGLVGLCFVVRGHYDRVARAVQKLEADILPKLYTANPVEPGPRDTDASTAVILVSGFNGLGLATLLQIEELFPKQFRNIVFVGVSEVDSSQMRSHEQIEALETRMADDLQSYCELAQQLGFHAEQCAGLGPDVVLELRLACTEVMRTFSHCVFFAGSLVFEDESEGMIERFLHNHTAYEIQRWLQIQGRSMVILPVCVSLETTAPATAAKPSAIREVGPRRISAR